MLSLSMVDTVLPSRYRYHHTGSQEKQRTHAKDGFEMGEDSPCVQECKRVSDMQDINMPIQDGLQATLQIRRIERGRLRRQASRASFGKILVLVGEGGHVSVLQRHCGSPSQTPVPIVGVSACGKSEQLGNAFPSACFITGQVILSFGVHISASI